MYFPWAGFFEHLALADVLVWLDDVQFSKGSRTNRIQVKLPGGPKWMTIPLRGKGTNVPIVDLASSAEDWKPSHRAMLEQSLRGAPHFDLAAGLFDAAMANAGLCDLLIASCELPARLLQCLPAKIVRSSAMSVAGKSSTRVLDIVRSLGGDRYVTGHGAASYLDHGAFDAAGIAVEYMSYGPEPWPQAHGPFTPYVTVLDLIAAKGVLGSEHLRPQTVGWQAFLQATT